MLHPILAGTKGSVPGGFPGRVPAPRSSQRLARHQAVPGETLRKFIQCFTQKMNTIPCIKQELVIQSFHANVRHTRMHEKLSTHRIETTRELWELTDRCARAGEGVRVPGEEEPKDKDTLAKSKKQDPVPTSTSSSPSLSPRRSRRPQLLRARKIHGATSTPTATTCSRTAAK